MNAKPKLWHVDVQVEHGAAGNKKINQPCFYFKMEILPSSHHKTKQYAKVALVHRNASGLSEVSGYVHNVFYSYFR